MERREVTVQVCCAIVRLNGVFLEPPHRIEETMMEEGSIPRHTALKIPAAAAFSSETVG
jgi:hypothetical protein